VASGQLNVNSASALGTGTLTLRNGAQFRNSSGAALINSGNNAVILNGTNQFTGGILDMGTGSITVEGDSRLNIVTGNLILGGNLTGTNAFNKDGIGTLTLAGSNSASSLVVVDYGILALANINALANANLYLYGTSTNKKVTFALAGNNNYNIGGLSGASTGTLDIGGNTVTLGGSGRSGSFAGQITGTEGNFTKAGSGTYTLSGSNDYTGTTTVLGGALKIIKSGSFTADVTTNQITVAPESTPIAGSTYKIFPGSTGGNTAFTVVFSTGLSAGLQANFDPTTSTVTVASSGPSYSSWAGGVAMDSDVDANGMSALLEYAFGANAPGQMDPNLKPSTAITNAGGTNQLAITYYVRKGDASLQVEPQSNQDLSMPNDWTNNPAVISVTTNPATFTNGNGDSLEQRTARVGLDGTREFLRLKVSHP